MVRRKVLWRVSLASIILLASAAAFFFVRPTWVFDRIQKLRLKMDGVQSAEVWVDGFRIHYYVRGPESGEPVVLIHGLGGRAEDWDRLAPYLVAAGYRVYTPDLLGFGQSEEPPNATYSISEEAQIVVNWMDRVGLRKVDLAGWSMGGWIAQKVAIEQPRRIRRLIIMDSVGLSVPPKWDLRLFTPNTPDELNRLHELLTPNAKPVPGFLAHDILRLSTTYSWVIKKALTSMLTAQDVTDNDLPNLKMPVLLLWGAEDQVAPISEGRAMHALIPQSRLVVASGCGHLAPQECADRFGPAVVNFLKADPPPKGDEVSMARLAPTWRAHLPIY